MSLEQLCVPAEDHFVNWELAINDEAPEATREFMAAFEVCSNDLHGLVSNPNRIIGDIEAHVALGAEHIPEDCSLEKIEALLNLTEKIMIDASSPSGEWMDPALTSNFLRYLPPSILNRIATSPQTDLRDRLIEYADEMLDNDRNDIRMDGVARRARLLGYNDAIEYAVAYCDDQSIDTVPLEYDINLLYDLSFVLAEYPRTEYVDEGDESTAKKRDFAERYIGELLNLSPILVVEIMSAMDERIRIAKTDWISSTDHIEELQALYESCCTFTPEELMHIYEETGIVNFGLYSEAQLSRMLKFADRDPELLDDLQNGPVMVCIKDAIGDHNGALSQDPEIFEGLSATTLFFEVSSAYNGLVELGRYAEAMAERGVSYDTVVLAAHGFTNKKYSGSGGFDLGGAMIAAEEAYARKESKQYPDSHDIFASNGLEKLFAGLVPDETGEANIFLLSCEQGSRKNKYQVATSEVLADFAKKCMHMPAACTVYGIELSTNIDGPDEEGRLYALHGDVTVASISAADVVRYRVAENGAQLKGLMTTSEREDSVAAAGDWARRAD